MSDGSKKNTEAPSPADAATEVPPLELREEFPAPSYEEWRSVVDKDLKGAPYEKKLVWKTHEGIAVEPLYRAEDLEGISHLGTLPGFEPYVRGTYPLSSVSPNWQIRQDCLLASPEGVNQAVRDGIARGQTAIAIRLDDAARRGLDGDAPEARELAGRGGTTLSSINGMRLALQDIELEKWPVTFRTGSAALPVLAMLVALADERGLDRRMLTGAVECDPVRSLAKTGTVRGSMDLQYREMAEIVAFCAKECPGIRGVMANSHVYHGAGASATQELAYVLAAAVEYLRALTERGISVDHAAQSIVFSVSVSTNMFMEIAKLRAARLLWSRIVKAFGPGSEASGKMFLHARTSTWTKAKLDPYNNMIRTSIEGFAAAVGGADSIYIAPFDETIGRPDDFGMRVARNQQLLLREEVHLDRIVDAAGGSYYVEALTDSVAQEAWKLLQEVEQQGGLVEAMKAGSVQKAIGEVRARKEAMIAQRRESIVGVSNYANPSERKIEKGHIAREEFLARRRERLHRLKSMRKNSDVRNQLGMMTNACADGEVGTLLPVAVKAAALGATIGEMTAALTAATEGTAPQVEKLPGRRASMPYEDLREQAEKYRDEHGHLPRILLAGMGPLGMRRARADFCHGFFSAGGFETVEPAAFKDAAEIPAAVAEHQALLVVVCSADEEYSAIVPAAAGALKDAGAKASLWVAGYPETVEDLKKAGAAGFVHIRANQLETLQGLQKDLLDA